MTGQNTNTAKSPWLWFVAGTGTAILGAAIVFQCIRPQPGTAAEDSSARTTSKTGASSSSGKTTLNPSTNATNANGTTSKAATAARVTAGGKSLAISMDDVANECINRVGKDVLESMINRAIIQLACQSRNVQVTGAEVEQEIVRIAAEFRIPVEQWLQMLQAERSISPQQYQRDVIWPMLALKKLAGADVTVTAQEIKTAFEREYGPRVKARLILCDNLRHAQTAHAKIDKDPENFERYVQEFSIDPTSKSLDGSIPPIPRHSGNKNLEDKAFSLQPGEISGIIQLDGGVQRYAILKCEGRTEPVVRKLDDKIQAELADQIQKQKIQEAVAELFQSLKDETRVDNYYANTSTGDPKVAKAAKAPASGTAPNTSARKESAGTIQPASGKTTSPNRVKPAAANTAEDFDLAPPRTARPPTARPTTNATK